MTEKNNSSENIVITGFSGRFPESDSVEELAKNLYDHTDMTNDEPRRWKKGLYGLDVHIGKMREQTLRNFDMQFFNVTQKHANYMDPQLRIALETTYEAIVDAGYNIQELRGARIGVYFAASISEVENEFLADEKLVNGYTLLGCARSMLANRLSFFFDFSGPSYVVDSACSSSLVALDRAYEDLKLGKIQGALVVGSNNILRAAYTLQFKKLGLLSDGGKCCAFDENASGYVRAEAIVSIFLQKESDARRIYSQILNVGINTDGFTREGIVYPSQKMQYELLKETYAKINLSPDSVFYVEAHGTGTKVGDLEEIGSISQFFCKNRGKPLYVGSIKTNIGHSEPVAGLCSISKILIAMENKMVPANLNYKTPHPEYTVIVNGDIEVVHKNLPWDGGIMGVSGYGFGGGNGHVILKSNLKEKNIPEKEDLSTSIVLVSGRTKESIEKLLSDVENHKNYEFNGLLNKIHSKHTPLHEYRGFAIIDNEKKSFKKEINNIGNADRPIWFIYSGMGSQWPGMIRDMMKIEVFRNSMMRSAECLKPKGIDLIKLLTDTDDSIYTNLLLSFISISTVSVALTDVLKSLNINPAGYIGHSMGEMGCAYVDGCVTTEQVALCAYNRACSTINDASTGGLMAAVGLSSTEVEKYLPNDVYIACYNNSSNVTISGPEKSVTDVVTKLKAQGIFAKAVKSSGYAFHTKYVMGCAENLEKNLTDIITNPKKRSSKWISTSVHESEWNSPKAQLCSGEYLTDNYSNPVYFEQALRHVPANAICIEIAPHGLMQSILKRALTTQTHLTMMAMKHENNIDFMLTNLGR